MPELPDIHNDEAWWVMLIDASNPLSARFSDRYYLSEPGAVGCKRVLADMKKSASLFLLVVNKEQVAAILDRFENMKDEGDVLDIGHPHDQAWLIWLNMPTQEVIEQWVWTADPHEAERVAMMENPGSSALLRASLSDLRKAIVELNRIVHGDMSRIWLDLRDPPRRLSPAQLLELKPEHIPPDRMA